MNSSIVGRIRIVIYSLCLFALIIIIKLYFIQIVSGDDYKKKADSQYVKPSNTILKRGTIFFESKDKTRIAGATTKDGFIVSINPSKLQENSDNIENVYQALQQYLRIEKSTFLEKTYKRNDQYEEIGKKIDRETGLAINNLKIPGVVATNDSWRVYPGGISISPQVIGLVGSNDKNEVAGRYGLERFYQDVLSKKDNISSVNFFAELFSDIESTIFNKNKKQGDIVSSIDPVVEDYLYKILEKTKNTWKSDSIGGIIMDPVTGEIYSMALLPSFDPNNTKNIDNPKIFSNSLVEDVYEMGSIIKPLTMASGIDSGVITPASNYDDKGFMELDGKKISNYDGKARGVINIQEVLIQSLNIGAATIALKVGSEEFSRYFLSFGLGEKTGIDQPNEQKGIVNNLLSKRDIEHATASYGQGIAMSPITTIRSLSILANGGKLVRPHIIKEIDYDDGNVEKIDSGNAIQVIKKETSETVTKMLVEVVDKAISKKHPGILIPHFSIAAKTGTAQIADSQNGGYYSDRYLHSFFGYFPAYNPRFIVFLYHRYPKGAEYASETLTEPFIDITKFLINYYEIEPDR